MKQPRYNQTTSYEKYVYLADKEKIIGRTTRAADETLANLHYMTVTTRAALITTVNEGE